MLAEALLAISSRVHHTPCFPHHASQLCLPPNSPRFKHRHCQAFRKEGSLWGKSQREILSHQMKLWHLWIWQCGKCLSFNARRLIGQLKIENSRLHTQIVYQIASRVLGQFFPLSYTCSWHIYVQCRQANSSISLSKVIIRNTCCCSRKTLAHSPNKSKWTFPQPFWLFILLFPFSNWDDGVGCIYEIKDRHPGCDNARITPFVIFLGDIPSTTPKIHWEVIRSANKCFHRVC